MVDNSANIKQNLIEAYNQMASERDSLVKEDWKVEQRDMFFGHLVRNGARSILEIGAGTGQDGLFFQEHGFDVTCVDMSPAMVSHCRAKGLTAQEMDFANLQFPDESFDAVWALNCLLHVPKQEIDISLREVKRVLRKGGLFYMGVYGRENSEGVWEDDTYVPKRFFSFYDDDTLRQVLSRYFNIVSFVTLPHTEHLDFQSVVMLKPHVTSTISTHDIASLKSDKPHSGE